MAGQHDSFGARGPGDRRHAGVVLPAPGIEVAVGVVAELGQHPGAEDRSEAGLAAVDLNVRVLAKTLLHLPGQYLGLGDHHGQHRDQRRRARRIRGHDTGPGGQLLAAQRGPDLGRGRGDVALPTRLAEQRFDPGLGQPPSLLRRRRGGQDRQRIPISQVGAERHQRGRVVLPQQRPQRVDLPDPGPDHRLMRPGRDLDMLSDLGVPSDRAVMGPVQPDHLGQQMRITRVFSELENDHDLGVEGAFSSRSLCLGMLLRARRLR